MLNSGLRMLAYRPEFALETVKMWRASFQRALLIEEHNRFDDLLEHLNYFASLKPEQSTIVLDSADSRVIGLMTLSGSYLITLFVDVDCQNKGVGKHLLNEAKTRNPSGLSLHTLAKNRGAQAFYLSQGFTEIERGFASFDGNPWAQTQADLADIKYQWLG